MSDNTVDYYDVQRMIEDEASRLRGQIDNAVRDACRELRSEFHESLASLERTLASRTEHLA